MKYYSEILNDKFDTVKDLEKAEAEHAEKLKEKEEAAKVRKDEAKAVEEKIRNQYEVEQAAKKEKTEAYKDYLRTCDEIDKKVKEAREEKQKALKAFCEKYKEGFHETITLNDVDYRYDYSTNTTESFLDPFIKLLNWF